MSNPISSQLPILLVDDEPQILQSASLLLRSAGITQVMTRDDSRQVLPLLAERPIGAIVLDLTMPHLLGQELLARIVADYPDIPVIIVTATNELETAVQCMQAGALDYLLKPVEKNRLVSSVTRAMEIRALREEVLSLKERFLSNELQHWEAFAEIVTQSKALRAIFQYMEAVAASPQPVLVTGETGTGKELFARAIHTLSGRSGEFIAVNAAGLDDNMFSDTLFGHKKGAFTGAEQTRPGLIAAAAEGTLFLDEIGDLAPPSQVKLLRLLQDHTYYPLGVDQPRRNSARVVVATNRDVPQRVDEGTFRKDLYYRLRAHHIQLPPLRQRKEDLPLLINHFLEKAAHSLGKAKPTVPPELMGLLKNYSFPGNVRELEAMVFDAVTRHRGGTLSLKSFREAIGQAPTAVAEDDGIASIAPELSNLFAAHFPTLKQAEEYLIAEALRRADNNQGIAAGMLGLSRQALNKRLVRSKRNGDPGA